MMVKLLARVQADVESELQEARKNNGHYFHSNHEGFAVLAEEAQEADDEAKSVGGSVKVLFHWLRMDNPERMKHVLTNIRYKAIQAAAEFIQVAAMAEKMIESMEEGSDEREND